jgi:plastocyanin
MSHSVRFASIAGTLALVAAACLVFAFLIPQSASTSAGEVRLIHLVVHNMAYYVAGRNDPNPTLHLRRDERVQVIVTNQDAGMKHDFGIDAWRQRTNLIDGIGEARLEFVAPSVPGEVSYSCTPHGTLMRGTIRVD